MSLIDEKIINFQVLTAESKQEIEKINEIHKELKERWNKFKKKVKEDNPEILEQFGLFEGCIYTDIILNGEIGFVFSEETKYFKLSIDEIYRLTISYGINNIVQDD